MKWNWLIRIWKIWSKVSFSIKPVPGAKDPIEILTVKVQTDGSIGPKDAISYSATYIREHLKFVEAIANPEILEISKGVSDETLALRNLLNQAIDEMELSVRSFNCLQAAGIKYIHELVSKEENQMLNYKNFGRKSLRELREKLNSMGLHFGIMFQIMDDFKDINEDINNLIYLQIYLAAIFILFCKRFSDLNFSLFRSLLWPVIEKLLISFSEASNAGK